MAAITPSTNLKLLKNPNNLSSQNQIAFSSKESQFNYFNSLQKINVDDFTYQRKDYTIRYPACIDDIMDYNYCMYQNEYYNDKWFYAYITNMRYLNDNATEITIRTDVFQTYQFDITYKASFIEREHVSDDTVGLHTIPEGLETGEYVCNNITSLYSGGNSTYICVATSEVPSEMGTNVYNRQYNGIYSGVTYVVFEYPLDASNFIRALDGLGKGDAVTAVFLIPTNLTGALTFTVYNIRIDSDHTITTSAAFPTYTTTHVTLGTVSGITSPTTLNGYTPKNNKCYVFPYNYFYITNNVGMDADFHYEDFINNTAAFKTIGAITPGCSIKCFPLNYKKLADNSSLGTMNSYNYGISGAKYPICSWNTDVYTNWLTQNGVNIGGITLNAAEKGYVGGALMAGLGVAQLLTGNVAGAATTATGLGQIASAMQENYRHSLIPDSAKGNLNSGDITFSAGNMDIPLYKMSIRAEMAASIDNYFSMYGYRVNTLKVPNTNNRTNWNYIKTIGANIEGLIPEVYINEIRSLFDNGITLWHTTTHFLDYSQTNSIVT